MLEHVADWLTLLTRWAHLIVGIAWIGASFYFNWLENRLHRRATDDDPIAGDLWAIHGGGFYYLQKYRLAPETLPKELHWFKWEAYTTWITGMLLLVLVYYSNARSFLIDPAVAELAPWEGIAIGLGGVLLSWFFYDLSCRSAVSTRPRVLALMIALWFVILSWGLENLLSARAAFLHIGAAIGTIMVANVFRVIIPSQRELVAAVTVGRAPNPAFGKAALLRSRHNNYFTLPVLFIMISIHFPMIVGHPQNLWLLFLIALAGVAIRHWFNIRHLQGRKNHWWLIALAALLVAGFLTRPGSVAGPAITQTPTLAGIQPLVREHCAGCHAVNPTTPGFTAPPLGIALESAADIERSAAQILETVWETRLMPLGNLTAMTEAEREQLAAWAAAQLAGGEAQ